MLNTAVLITHRRRHRQIWANAGVDVLAFDLEHGHIDPTTLHALIAATAGTDVVPAVRVAAKVAWLVKQALDAGAMGIVFPLIRNAADAAAAVAAAGTHCTASAVWGRSSPRSDEVSRLLTQRAVTEVLAPPTAPGERSGPGGASGPDGAQP